MFGDVNLGGCFLGMLELGGFSLEVAIGRAGPGWAGPIVGKAKIGPIFLGQHFNSPARPKNGAGRAK